MVKYRWQVLFAICLVALCSPGGVADEPSADLVDDAPATGSDDAPATGDDDAPATGDDDAPATGDDDAPAAGGDEANADEAGPPNAEVQPSDDAPRVDLRYKFTPGEVLRTEVTHRATVHTTIQGTTQTAETQSKSIKAWKVQYVDDQGAVTFTHSIEKIEMWQRIQGRQEIRYNSETDTEVPPGYEDVAKAVGIPLTVVTMDDRGKILKRQEKSQQSLSLSSQMSLPLPAQPVAVGQNWTSPLDIDVVLKDGSAKKIKTQQKFTLRKLTDNIATIAVETQVLTPISDPAIEAQLIQRMSSGHVRFDMEAGRVIDQQLDLDHRVIGFSGPSSSMHYLTRFTEELLPPGKPSSEPQTARRSAPAKDAGKLKQPAGANKRPAR